MFCVESDAKFIFIFPYERYMCTLFSLIILILCLFCLSRHLLKEYNGGYNDIFCFYIFIQCISNALLCLRRLVRYAFYDLRFPVISLLYSRPVGLCMLVSMLLIVTELDGGVAHCIVSYFGACWILVNREVEVLIYYIPSK